MFEKNSTTPTSPAASVSPRPSPVVNVENVTQRDANTYTIPEKYLPPTHHIPVRSSRRVFIIGGIILFVVFGVIAVVVYALQFVTTPEPVQTPTSTISSANNTPSGNQNVVSPNSNANANINVATNDTNANADANTNGVTNSNTNDNANTNTSTNTTEPPAPLQVVAIAADKDRDDLTDTEEELYGTKISLPDTDKDGFVDGTEVKNLYSPLKADETLLKSGIVTEYKNKKLHWSALYPTSWLADVADPEGREVLFTPDTGEGEWIEVLITDNPTQQTVAEWYSALYPDNSAVGKFSAVEVAGLKGIVTSNGLTYYLANGSTIIGFVYNVGTGQSAHFQTTFAMIVKSFTLTNDTAP